MEGSSMDQGGRSEFGAVLMVGVPGPTLDDQTAHRLVRLDPAGVILFRRNLETPEQTRGLLATLHRVLPRLVWVALDQEGGRVSRLEPWIGATPSAAILAARGSEAVHRFALATGRALRALGFNLDFAPVVDLCAADVRNGIGDRSFGCDPHAVATLAETFLDGLGRGGVAGCLKHFPGLGPTSVDSHVELPVVNRSRDEMTSDLHPYRHLLSRAPCVMIGHATYPQFDRAEGLPATLTPEIGSGLLRGELGFEGLAVSDDLEMGAVAEFDVDGGAAPRALSAGCDLLLYCADLDRAEAAAEAMARSASRDVRFALRWREATRRVRAAAARWPARIGTAATWEAALHEVETAVRG